jgi:3-hydroxymyristoyl/3-hydroxydecanoyl-(acyl carrier protein) dehydratase
MRYRFLDEVTSLRLEPPLRISVATTLPAGHDVFTGPAGPVVPGSILIELMAMAGGYLLYRRLGRGRLPLLAKVSDCRFDGEAGPDTRLEAVAEIDAVGATDAEPVMAEARAEVRAGGRRLAAARLLFACVAVQGVDLERFEPVA